MQGDRRQPDPTERGASALEMAMLMSIVVLVAMGAVKALGATIGGEDVDTASAALGDTPVRIDSSTPTGRSASQGAGGRSGTFGTVASGAAGTAQQVGSAAFDHGEDRGYWNTRGTGETIGDWNVVRGTVDARTTHSAAFNHEIEGNFLDMNGGGPGRIEREMQVIPGAEYNLSVDLGENSYGGPPVKLLAIEWNGKRISMLEVDLPRHTTRTYTVQIPPSDSETAVLAFESFNYSAHGVLVDNPTITLIPTRLPD